MRTKEKGVCKCCPRLAKALEPVEDSGEWADNARSVGWPTPIFYRRLFLFVLLFQEIRGGNRVDNVLRLLYAASEFNKASHACNRCVMNVPGGGRLLEPFRVVPSFGHNHFPVGPKYCAPCQGVHLQRVRIPPGNCRSSR